MDKTEPEDQFLMIYKSFFNNPIWREKRKFSKAECWIDILNLARYSEEEKTVIFDNKPITCGQGQSLLSLDSWSLRWGMSKSSVRRLFQLFTKLEMIITENVGKTTRLTVLNYKLYADKRNASGSHKKRTRNASGSHSTPIVKGIEGKESIDYNASALAVYENYVSIGSNQTGHKKTQALKNIASMLRKGKTKEDLILYAENYRESNPSNGYVVSCSNFYGQNKGYEEYKTLEQNINTSSSYPDQMEVIRELFDDEEFEEFMNMQVYPRDYAQRLRKYKVGQNV